MLTTEIIRNEFSYVKAWTGDAEAYHNAEVYDGYSNLCDLYFKSGNKDIKEEQIAVYNLFRTHLGAYLSEVENHLLENPGSFEKHKAEEIRNAALTLDIIEVPYDNGKYDLVFVCSKTYKNFLFFKQEINVRIELRHGKIQSIQRKKDVTEDND
jgi:hypothetical protein